MRFLSLDLNLLRVFDAVMTEQNLTRAAGTLAMTQPAVSNALKRLRDALGDDLLIRTAYGVKPTPRAEALWPAVARALADLEAAIIPEEFDVGKAHGTFRMAMSDAIAALWLPSLVRSGFSRGWWRRWLAGKVRQPARSAMNACIQGIMYA